MLGVVPLAVGLVVLSLPLLPRLWRGIAATRAPDLLDPVVKGTAWLLYCAGVLIRSLL